MPPLKEYRHPCPGGYQIQAGDMLTAGTLGAKVSWGNPARDVVITAGHIVNRPNASVFQPQVLNPQGEVQRIGRVTEKSPHPTYRSVGEFMGSPDDPPGRRVVCNYDFAYIDVAINPEATSYEIPGIHEIDQTLTIRDPRDGDSVCWLGKSTGIVQRGRVVDTFFWLPRILDPNNAADLKILSLYPMTLIEVEGNTPTQEGDSGAAVVADDGKIVGIHCQGGRNKSGKYFTWASRVPVSPEALANGSASVSWDEVMSWSKKTGAWRNS
jgi:hypothetical protein